MGTFLDCVKSCDLQAAADAVSACLNACAKEEGLTNSSEKTFPAVVAICLSCVLVPLTGLFAGLTIGLFSLDLVGLRILEEAGEPDERIYAKAIYPVRKKGNLLLCTLLLGNTVANSALSILLADLTSGLFGLLLSTVVILIFGEILPQSLCVRYGLKIGAKTLWIVKIVLVLMFPIAWPLSKVLDWLLGRDIGTVYSLNELKHLIGIHATDPEAQKESGLTGADHKLLIGVLGYKEKRVQDVMTTLEQCFMLEKGMHLDFQTMLMIYKSGFTRIPVYSGVRQNIVGVLYAKDLILIDPDDQVEIGAVLSFSACRGRNLSHVYDDVKLDDVFKKFITSNNHLFIAHRRVYPAEADMASDSDGSRVAMSPVTGLITLEDVMEELIQAEIVDETDIYEDVNTRVLVPRRGGPRKDLAAFLSLFEHKLLIQKGLSSSELAAVVAFLAANVPEFAQLARHEVALRTLVSQCEVVEKDVEEVEDDHETGRLLGSPRPPAHRTPSGRYDWDAPPQRSARIDLYKRGQPSAAFTLVLQGHVYICTGAEDFELELGPWSTLGSKALTQAEYVPDFDAVAAPPCRLLRIHRKAYMTAIEATRLDPGIHQKALKSILRGTHNADDVTSAQDGHPLSPLGVNSAADLPQIVSVARSQDGKDSPRVYRKPFAPDTVISIPEHDDEATVSSPLKNAPSREDDGQV